MNCDMKCRKASQNNALHNRCQTWNRFRKYCVLFRTLGLQQKNKYNRLKQASNSVCFNEVLCAVTSIFFYSNPSILDFGMRAIIPFFSLICYLLCSRKHIVLNSLHVFFITFHPLLKFATNILDFFLPPPIISQDGLSPIYHSLANADTVLFKFLSKAGATIDMKLRVSLCI